MKKALWIAAVLIILVAFVACDPKPAPGPTPEKDPLVGVWVNIDEDPHMMVTTVITLKEDLKGSILYEYTPIDETEEKSESREYNFTWMDYDGYLSLLYDSSHYEPKYPGGNDRKNYMYIGFDGDNLLEINYIKGEYLITTRYEDCTVSEDGSEYTFVRENKKENSTHTVVFKFSKTNNTMIREETEEFHNDGSMFRKTLEWTRDEKGAGDNYTYRIWNDSLEADFKKLPFLLLAENKLVFFDEVFTKQM